MLNFSAFPQGGSYGLLLVTVATSFLTFPGNSLAVCRYQLHTDTGKVPYKPQLINSLFSQTEVEPDSLEMPTVAHGVDEGLKSRAREHGNVKASTDAAAVNCVPPWDPSGKSGSKFSL